jgi:hypothetical protein
MLKGGEGAEVGDLGVSYYFGLWVGGRTWEVGKGHRCRMLSRLLSAGAVKCNNQNFLQVATTSLDLFQDALRHSNEHCRERDRFRLLPWIACDGIPRNKSLRPYDLRSLQVSEYE